jgi:hypothetical protein
MVDAAGAIEESRRDSRNNSPPYTRAGEGLSIIFFRCRRRIGPAKDFAMIQSKLIV